MRNFCKNAFRGPGTHLVVSAALSRRKGPFWTRSWIGLAPCKKRRWMELALGQQEPLAIATRELRSCAQSQDISCPGRGASTAACCVGRPPDPFAPRLGRRSRRSSRRRSRSGPRKFEKLYVDGAGVLGRRPIGRRVAAAPRAVTRIIRGRTAGRAENDTPKTAFEVRVDRRRIRTSPIIWEEVITYIKSLYLDVRLVPRLRGRARLVRKPVNSKAV